MKTRYWVAELTDILFKKTWADKLGAFIGIVLLIVLFVLPILDWVGIINLPNNNTPEDYLYDGGGYRGP